MTTHAVASLSPRVKTSVPLFCRFQGGCIPVLSFASEKIPSGTEKALAEVQGEARCPRVALSYVDATIQYSGAQYYRVQNTLQLQH